jgi:hypothetical protein
MSSTPPNPYSSPPPQPTSSGGAAVPPKVNQRESATALDAIIPTNPLAAFSCYCGIFSMLFCFLGLILGPIAIFTGRKSLNKSLSIESDYGARTSKIRAWIGIVTGSIGTALGLAVIVLAIMGISQS